jgi:hypothetical protein
VDGGIKRRTMVQLRDIYIKWENGMKFDIKLLGKKIEGNPNRLPSLLYR